MSSCLSTLSRRCPFNSIFLPPRFLSLLLIPVFPFLFLPFPAFVHLFSPSFAPSLSRTRLPVQTISLSLSLFFSLVPLFGRRFSEVVLRVHDRDYRIPFSLSPGSRLTLSFQPLLSIFRMTHYRDLTRLGSRLSAAPQPGNPLPKSGRERKRQRHFSFRFARRSLRVPPPPSILLFNVVRRARR